MGAASTPATASGGSTWMPPAEDCEPVKWQSKQKHAFLEAYLRIWTQNVGQGAHSKGEPPSLQIVDLTAAFGWCHDSTLAKTWEGTAVLAAKCLKEYKTRYPKRLILNSFAPEGDDEQARQVGALKRAVANVGVGSSGCEVYYLSEKMVEAAQSARQFVDPRFPSLWILDPYSPESLPWSVIESVVKFEGQWSRGGSLQLRRPEVFISLQTHALQRNIDSIPQLLSAVLGLEESEWRPTFDRLRGGGLNVRDAIVDLYVSRLRAFYSKEPFTVKVASAHGNVVYILIFCTDSDAGHYMMKKEGQPKYAVWRDKKWNPAARFIGRRAVLDRKAAKAGQRMSDLFEFAGEEE